MKTIVPGRFIFAHTTRALVCLTAYGTVSVALLSASDTGALDLQRPAALDWTVPHDTRGGVNVLNLIQGECAIVEGDFEPFVVHYAETFIVPASVGHYTIRPYGTAAGSECATITANVRT